MSTDAAGGLTNSSAQYGQGFIQPLMTTTAPVLLAVFMATMILPVSFDLAGLRLTPIRIVLLLSFIPIFIQFLSGRAGKIIAIDLLMMLFCVWMAVTLLYHEGLSKIAFSGISVVELLGGYLLGRCLIRNVEDFKLLIRFHLICLLVLFPFSLIDLLTGKQLWAELLDTIGSVKYRGASSRPRMGMERVLTGFEHPILYGMFCSMGAANAAYIWRKQVAGALLRLGFVTGMTFMALSSGALLSVMIQVLLMLWDWIMKSRWKLLLVLTAILYVFLEFASNRGPIIIFIETLTFSSGTAWTRVIQWEYGTAEVMRYPILGKGLDGNWIRPSWLYTSSIDNYWLVVAFRHGLPGIGLLLGAFGLAFWRIIRTPNLSEEYSRIRTGYCIVFLGICFTMATVHIWGAIQVFIYFYLGAGMWILQGSGVSDGKPMTMNRDPRDKRKVIYNRTHTPVPVAPEDAAHNRQKSTPSRYSRTSVISNKNTSRQDRP